jgi:ribosomal-protein-alanine N-acetyltransferase
LLARFEATAQTRAAREAVLEVAADNMPARALYARADYAESGLRRGYYQHPDGTRTDALILRKLLSEN